jgi:hypothetical protein
MVCAFCAVMLAALCLQLWENNWDFKCLKSGYFFLFSLTLSLAFCAIFSSSSSAAAREKQSAERLDTLKRTLEVRNSLESAAREKVLRVYRKDHEADQKRISQAKKAYDELFKTAGLQISMKQGLQRELEYAKQRINKGSPTEGLVASLYKAQQEIIGLKTARDLAVVPAGPVVSVTTFVTAASGD